MKYVNDHIVVVWVFSKFNHSYTLKRVPSWSPVFCCEPCPSCCGTRCRPAASPPPSWSYSSARRSITCGLQSSGMSYRAVGLAYLNLLNFCSSLQTKRSTIEGNLRRYYPDGDIEAKIRNDIRFLSSFHFLWAMVRTESKRFAENAEEGMLKSYSMKTWLAMYRSPKIT